MRGGAGRAPDIGGMGSAGRGRAGLIRKLIPPANGPAAVRTVPARLRRAIADRARPAARRRPERAQPRSVLAPARGAPEALHGPDGVFRVRHHDRHTPVGDGDPGHAGPGTVWIGRIALDRARTRHVPGTASLILSTRAGQGHSRPASRCERSRSCLRGYALYTDPVRPGWVSEEAKSRPRPTERARTLTTTIPRYSTGTADRRAILSTILPALGRSRLRYRIDSDDTGP